MNAKLKRQEVTSGRLAGTLKVNRQTPAGPPDAAFSLYSTDSEEQVSTLHRGLDRCAVLLDHILQVDAAGISSPPRTPSEGATRRRTPAGKKKLPGKPGQSPGRTTRSFNHSRPGSHTVKAGAARSRVNTSQGKSSSKRPTSKTGLSSSGLHGRVSSTPTATQTCAAGAQCGPRPRPLQRRAGRSPLPPEPPAITASLRPSQQVVSVPPECCQLEGAEQDCVPVRDPGPHSSAADPPRSVEEQEAASCSRTTVHRLLEELKATTAEQDRLAEHVSLERSSSPPQVRLEPSSPSAERAEGWSPGEGVLGLQGELESAQARLQQLQEDLGGLRRALQDTQSQLKDVQAENALLKTDLDFHKQQLLDGERVNRELASLAQLRLEEMEKLQSLLQSAADTPTDRIKGFLRSLSQVEPTPTEHVQERRSPPPGDAFPQSDRENPHLQASARRARSPSLCDSASLWSAWSARSSSTFDTRDEASFRDGLAALDASIASLQRTFQLDLRRC